MELGVLMRALGRLDEAKAAIGVAPDLGNDLRAGAGFLHLLRVAFPTGVRQHLRETELEVVRLAPRAQQSSERGRQRGTLGRRARRERLRERSGIRRGRFEDRARKATERARRRIAVRRHRAVAEQRGVEERYEVESPDAVGRTENREEARLVGAIDDADHSCAGRSVNARARRRLRRRASSDITAPPALLVASPARLYQSRHRRRRASAEPRASRRADRAPPTSSCVRRSFHRRTCAPCRVHRRASIDITAPLLSSSHRRLGSIRADTGDAERAPSRERLVVPTERRRPGPGLCSGRRVAPTSGILVAARRSGYFRAD